MDKLEKLIFEKVAAGKIDRETAFDMLMSLKGQDRRRTKDIAVIGVSLRMPEADNLEAYWQGIRSRRELIRRYPDRRQKDVKGFIVNYTNLREDEIQFSHGGFLDEVDGFDYGFFNLSPKEASVMDPNQRMFLEAAWSAIEDAGYGGGKLSGSRTGVYVGYADWPVYGQYITKAQPELIQTAGVGNTPSILASRISYLLDLKGPAFLVDTACSSSLVAVHLACAAIKNGECDLALAGGVKVCLMPVEGVFDIGIESSNYKTSAFDDSSDGTVWGEGTVALLLKPLERALADNDQIYAVLKGSAINQDGASVGITAPNAEAQEKVLVQAWEEAGIAPETIGYFEAHGTGTKLGDPIEIDGIQRAFRKFTSKKQFCAIGSVKTNIGHLDGASGIAGLAKAIAALHYKELPPTINFARPNRKIAFEHSPVYVNDRLSEWQRGVQPSGEAVPRRSAVSSFGFSGTNAHVVLEEAPERPAVAERAGADGSQHVLALSAKTAKALEALIGEYRRFLRSGTTGPAAAGEGPVRSAERDGWPDGAPVTEAATVRSATAAGLAAGGDADVALRDICYTANTGRGHYGFRAAIVAADRAELLLKLDAFAAGGLDAASKADAGAPDSGIAYGEHRVVTLRREQRQPGELTTGDMRALSEQAAELQLSCAAEGRSPSAAELAQLCRLYVQGAEINWELLYAGETRRKTSVPLYPFQRTRCWIDVDAIDAARERAAAAAGPAADAGPAALAPALPAVALKGRADGAYLPLERQLVAVWGQLLGLEEIDVDDDFFELGGNSILAIRLEVDLERLGIRVESDDLYRVRSVRELARHIAGAAGSGAADASAAPAPADAPPSAAAASPAAAGEAAAALAAPEAGERVVLNGVEPFNDVFYRNCFYNSMFPVALYYQESILPFLVNDLIVYTHADGRYRIDYESVQPIELVFEQAGLAVETCEHHDGIVEALIASIAAGKPVVIWVDSFYESIRRDAYNREHFDHTLLVYGYDRAEKLFHIIEHDRRENLSYKPQVLPFDDVALACAGFIERFRDASQPIARYTFGHRRPGQAPDRETSTADSLRTLARNLQAGQSSLAASHAVLRAFVADYREATASAATLEAQTQPFVDFLNDVLNAKQVERYRLTQLFGETAAPVQALAALTHKWDVVRKGMVRFLYMPVYKPEPFAAGYSKLLELLDDEEQFHRLLASALEDRINQQTY